MTDDGMVLAGDLRLFVSRTGAQSGPPLILLHGLGGDHTTWDGVAERLGARYCVLAVDQRGHGSSDHAADYSFRLLAEDVWRLADALGLDRVRLVGHSMGGLAALIAAQLEPDRVAALVVEEAPPPVALDRPDVEPPDQPTPYDFALINRFRAELRSPDPANWSRLESITAPVLILTGGPASALPQREQAELAARIPDASVRTLPYGHGIHQGEGQSAFCDTVNEFLGADTHAS